MNTSQILLVLGGTYHDFEGFAAAMTPALEAAGHSLEATYDLDTLTQLEEGRYDVVLLYTCLGEPEGDAEPELHTEAQVNGLTQWVLNGGGVLAAHASTVAAKSNAKLRELVGGVFVEHPPQFAFTVYPVYREHPIIAGVKAFAVHDEFYVQVHERGVDVHMVALDRGVACPMVWTKHEGKGRVAHIAIGHDDKVWNLEPYQQLMLQAVAWLTG